MGGIRETAMTDAIFPDPTGIETDPAVREKLERFRDMKFGLMIHWGPYNVWGAVESWPICNAEPYGRERLAAWEHSGKDVAKFMEAYREGIGRRRQMGGGKNKCKDQRSQIKIAESASCLHADMPGHSH